MTQRVESKPSSENKLLSEDRVRALVRETYGAIARADASAPQVGCCAPPATQAAATQATTLACCGPGPALSASILGYTSDELAALPEGANLGLGCGNPNAIAGLRLGETVLDLGSGAGIDCFLAARQVGESGRVIGVDMTPDMVAKARSNAARVAATNVEFRLGEIEHLPVGAGEVDVILSNCVVNLSPDKKRVFREAFRVLKTGGRIAISDVVLLQPLPKDLADDALALSGCIAGAATVDELETALKEAGFSNIRVEAKPESRAFIASWLPGSGAEDYVASATIEATKPEVNKACCGPSCCS